MTTPWSCLDKNKNNGTEEEYHHLKRKRVYVRKIESCKGDEGMAEWQTVQGERAVLISNCAECQQKERHREGNELRCDMRGHNFVSFEKNI